MDVLRYIGAVTRRLETREVEGKPARVAHATCAYDTDADDLWDALTNADRIPRWFMPITGELRVGGRYQLQGNAGGVVKACDPPKRFEITWEMGPQVSWVNVTLTPRSDGGTTLHLEHIAHVPPEFWDQYGPGAVGVGWDLALMGLGEHTRSGGATVDPSNAMAWMASEEGREFIRQSSEAWGEASIAGGTDAEAARAAVTRTTAFYTGA
ncbi:MAG: SRPBCC family protein [Bryobacterales bacterium]|nr:SRPBCC family protein [Bryobacterales bacterium]